MLPYNPLCTAAMAVIEYTIKTCGLINASDKKVIINSRRFPFVIHNRSLFTTGAGLGAQHWARGG